MDLDSWKARFPEASGSIDLLQKSLGAVDGTPLEKATKQLGLLTAASEAMKNPIQGGLAALRDLGNTAVDASTRTINAFADMSSHFDKDTGNIINAAGKVVGSAQQMGVSFNAADGTIRNATGKIVGYFDPISGAIKKVITNAQGIPQPFDAAKVAIADFADQSIKKIDALATSIKSVSGLDTLSSLEAANAIQSRTPQVAPVAQPQQAQQVDTKPAMAALDALAAHAAEVFQAIILGATVEIPKGFTTGFTGSWCCCYCRTHTYDYSNSHNVSSYNSRCSN